MAVAAAPARPMLNFIRSAIAASAAATAAGHARRSCSATASQATVAVSSGTANCSNDAAKIIAAASTVGASVPGVRRTRRATAHHHAAITPSRSGTAHVRLPPMSSG